MRDCRTTQIPCIVAIAAFLLMVCACSAVERQVTGEDPELAKELEAAIAKYAENSRRVRIGDAKESVLATLQPTQAGLRGTLRKQPESFRDGKDLIEIYFFRTGWTRDGRTTDDEFTPYVFRNGVLDSIGWTALGGPKTHSGLIPDGRGPYSSAVSSQTVNPRGGYGPGVRSDAAGRPFVWKSDSGGPPLGPIIPNAYGAGVGMDGTGRPVRPACPPGWAGPC